MPRRLEARDATEVYVTDSGQIGIKQEDPLGNEPQIVTFEPGDIPTIIKWLEECAVDAREIREMNDVATLSEQVVPR
jgi:hypothetical protein